MKSRKKEVHLIICLQQFRNINLASKGCYRIKLQAFTPDKYLDLQYFQNEDIQQEEPELKNNYSIKVQCHSDEESSNLASKRTGYRSQNGKAFITLPFFVKYHYLGEKIKLKSIALFTQYTSEDLVEVKLSLWKKDTKLIDAEHFQPIQSVQVSIRCDEHFLQQKQILISAMQSCSFKMIFMACPLVSYDQIYRSCSQTVKQAKIKKTEDRIQLLLEQIRKAVKKQRYETFILRKQLSSMVKNIEEECIKLPLHFVQKQSMSMDQVETSELKFFKYLAFYQKQYTSAEMLKQEIKHINFDKVFLLKSFIQAFQKGGILPVVLDQKQKSALDKKLRIYLIENQFTYSSDKLPLKYSHEEFKAKKQKIKQMENVLNLSNNLSAEHVLENCFFNQKEQKTYLKPRNSVKYPLLLRDIHHLSKSDVFRSDTLMVCFLHNKTRKKKNYFIFAHGFQGLPVDLTYLINMIRFANQKVKTLVLKSYKNNMGQSIQLMAKKVAHQIQSFMKKIDLTQIQPEITFIGHSMGAIILRAALKHLFKFIQYFKSFVSICGPHLGYIQGTKFLTEAGLSIISKLKPIQSLNQLSNRDNTDLEKTFIYKLSKEGTLKHFKRVILMASMDDDYVPWHSARIEPFMQKGHKQKIEKNMIQNIFGIGSKETKIQIIERIEVSFMQQKDKSLNSFIGRTSHIKPLSDRGFLQIFTKKILFK